MGRPRRMGFNPGSGIIVRNDRVDRFGLSCPNDRTRLTQPDPVAEPLPREHDPVGLLFHAESCAAERTRTELPADHGPQAFSPDDSGASRQPRRRGSPDQRGHG